MKCPYCGSTNVFDMGPMDDEGNPSPPHHVECDSCRCAFEWEPPDHSELIDGCPSQENS